MFKFFASGALFTLVAACSRQRPTADMIRAIATLPNDKCPADLPDCRTAEQAAPAIALSLSKYGITNDHEMAAIVSLIAFESVDFRYKRNVSPGRPGQGTANMQMAEFNLEYAKSIPALKDQVAKWDSTTGLSDDELNEILDLVVPDQYNFGSGAWYYTTHCSDEVRKQLRDDPDKGYEAYMVECVGTEFTEDRQKYWTRAKKAFDFA